MDKAKKAERFETLTARITQLKEIIEQLEEKRKELKENGTDETGDLLLDKHETLLEQLQLEVSNDSAQIVRSILLDL